MTVDELKRAAAELRYWTVVTHRAIYGLGLDGVTSNDCFEESRMHRKLRRLEARIAAKEKHDAK